MIINSQKKIFMGQRIAEKAWQMPQGGIDTGEPPDQAAYRELREETGITKEKVIKISSSKTWITYNFPDELIPQLWNGKYKGQIQKWFLLNFTGNDTDININTAEREFSQWCWTDESNLLKMIVPFKQAVYLEVINEFKSKIKSLE